jgi:hypothetical protein
VQGVAYTRKKKVRTKLRVHKHDEKKPFDARIILKVILKYTVSAKDTE